MREGPLDNFGQANGHKILRMNTTTLLRADRRSRRASLSPEQISEASLDIAARIWHLPELARSRRIAAYHAFDGEVDCHFAIETAWRRGREVFLPVIHGQQILFAQYCAKTRFSLNRFGIPEPVCARRNLLHPSQMDVILTPLVAFDEHGNRIGMGAGFYDRSFRFLRHRARWRHPRMIGIAYEFQKAAQIKASGWDVPLHIVVTEQRAYRCS